MHALASGDRLRVSYPLQNFPLGVGAARYVLVAGGIGITALVGDGQGAAPPRCRLLAGAGRTLARRCCAYLDDLVAEHGDRLAVHVDDEGTGLDVDALVDEVARSERRRGHRALRVRSDPADGRRTPRLGRAGAAGPEPALRDLRQQRRLGARAVPRLASPALDREVVVGEDESMLDALEDAGVEVMWDCRKGECGLCAVRGARGCDGQIDHRDVFLSDEQKQRGDLDLRLRLPRRPRGRRGPRGGASTLTIALP